MKNLGHQRLGQPNDGFSDSVHDPTCYENCLSCGGNISGFLKIYFPCCCCCCKSPMRQVNTSKNGILQNFGRFKQVLDPGLHIINPWTQNIIQVDLKTVVLNLRPQQVITRDNVSLKIDTVVYYRTVEPIKLVYKLGTNFAEINNFISEMSYSAMRTIIGQHILQQLLEERVAIADKLQQIVKRSVQVWGLYIENIFIKDIILTQETQRNLQSATIQKRLSQAQIISAKADVQAAKMLKETSDILNSQSAMQIRYLQALGNIITSGNDKTVFVSLKGKQ